MNGGQNHIDVMLCVNNHRNGAFRGRLFAVNIFDFLDIDCAEEPERGCSFGANWFSVHRMKFKILSRSCGVGNWCWDSVRMEANEAARFIAFLLCQRAPIRGGGQYNVWTVDSAHGEAAIALADRHAKFQSISVADVLTAMKAERVTA